MPRLRFSAVVPIYSVLLLFALYARTYALETRPFWRDEAWVAQLATDLSWAEVWRPVEAPAPPLLIAAAKAGHAVVQPPELGMRLLAVISGLALVALTYPFLRDLRVPALVALAGMAVVAGSGSLVLWSRELKQYQTEALGALLVAWLVYRLHSGQRRGTDSIWAGRALILLCLVGPWWGYGLLFPIAALCGWLVLAPGRPRFHRTRMIGAGALAAAAGSAGVLSWVGAAEQAADPKLQLFMQRWYIDLADPLSLARAGGDSAIILSMAAGPQTLLRSIGHFVVFAAPLLALVIYGLCCWPRQSRSLLIVWVLGPWLLMAVAAVVRVYPYGMPRMALVLLPPLLFSLAMGTVSAVRAGWLRWRDSAARGMQLGFATACLCLLTTAQLPFAQAEFFVFHDYPAILRTVERVRAPLEPVFVEYTAVPSVRYYARQCPYVRIPPMGRGTFARIDFDYPRWWRQRLASAGRRCWIIASTETFDPPLRAVLEECGYAMRPHTPTGPLPRYGCAQLLELTRSR